MKCCLFTLLALALLLTLTACAAPPAVVEELPTPVEAPPVVEPPVPKEPFPGRIAIITETAGQNEEIHLSAQQAVKKYGEDKIMHFTWPSGGEMTKESTLSSLGKIAGDVDIKALVVNPGLSHANILVGALRQTRSDIFVVYCAPQEAPERVTEFADLVLEEDNNLGMGAAMVEQAHKLGATTFVYYPFPRHGGPAQRYTQVDTAKEKCEELGIEFAISLAPDPISDAGIAGTQQYILEDVPKMVAKYGKDTAFFSTNCSVQTPLIKAVLDQGAIYPQPCCPSPILGFPAALGIEAPVEELDGAHVVKYIIAETARILKEKGMLGRVSTWPVPVEFLQTNTGVEYAVKWLNGEVPQEGIDVDVLLQCMEDYTGVTCYTRPYVDEEGVEYPNFLLVREDYLTYGEEHIK